MAADTKDVATPDCEQVRNGPNAGRRLNEYLEASGFYDKLCGGLAPFPEG